MMNKLVNNNNNNNNHDNNNNNKIYNFFPVRQRIPS